MTHNAYLVETVTGQVGMKLDLISFSYTEPLNGIESGTVTVDKTRLKSAERKRFRPGFGSVLITQVRTDHFGRVVDEIPVIAGPIQSWPSEDRNKISFSFKGIRSVFEKRYVVRDEDPNKRTDIKLQGLSLGAIAQEVVKESMNRPGGSLPIRFGSPYEVLGGTTHTRTYEWWNISNLRTSDVLTKLTEVIGGPDIMFRPEFTDNTHQFIEWVMYHGTKDQPKIAQNRTADFDLTSAESGVVNWSLISDGSHMTNRVWGTGAGEGSGTVVTFSEDLSSVEDGYPFYETLISDSEITREKIALLKSYTDAEVRDNQQMIDQLSLIIDADHPKNPFGSWHVGDDISVTVEDSFSIPAGTYLMRIISASGSNGGEITLELQEISR